MFDMEAHVGMKLLECVPDKWVDYGGLALVV